MIKSTDNFISYVVFSSKTGVYEKPEFRIDFTDPYNKSYLIPYLNNEQVTLQFRETHVFKKLTAKEALAIGNKYKDNLFRFLDDYDSVTHQTSKSFCETIKWAEENPDDSTSYGFYSFFMDRILSNQEEKAILLHLGFDSNSKK